MVKRKRVGTTQVAIAGLVLIVLAVVGLFGWAMYSGYIGTTVPFGGDGDADNGGPAEYIQIGDTATLTTNSYDLEANAKDEIYPLYYIYKNGGLLVDGVAANATSGFAIGDDYIVYGGNSSIYVDGPVEGAIRSGAEIVQLDAHKVSAEASMVSTVKYELTELSTGANDTDYYDTLGANEDKDYVWRIKNNQANRRIDIKAICTFGNNMTEGSKFRPLSSDWTSVGLPEEVGTTSLTIADAGVSTTLDYDDCYEYKINTVDVIKLEQWQATEITMLVEVGTGDPVQNGSSLFGAVLVDSAWSKGKDNNMDYGWYRQDDNEKTTEVGMIETLSSPFGKTTGFVIEAR